jgi:hypothetical protein
MGDWRWWLSTGVLSSCQDGTQASTDAHWHWHHETIKRIDAGETQRKELAASYNVGKSTISMLSAYLPKTLSHPTSR